MTPVASRAGFAKSGTAGEGESLCCRCQHGHRQRGFRESEEAVFCTYVWDCLRAVPFKVAECSDFSERNMPSKWEMEEIALLIDATPDSRRIGFRSPGDQAEVEVEDE